MRMLKLALSTVLLLAIASVGMADPLLNLPPGWNWVEWTDPGTGVTHGYALTHNWETWEAAQSEAVLADGHLVVINTPAENAWLTTEFASMAYTFGHAQDAWTNIAWIGLWKPSPSGPWTWVDGTPLADTPFSSQQYQSTIYPTNQWPQGGTHAYLHLANHPDGAGKWNANNLHESNTPAGNHPMGIIESNTFAPEPAALSVIAVGSLALLRRRRI
jgi:hypothetical protein